MRVLITGASGFAGGYLCRACAQAGDEVIGVSRSCEIAAGAARALDLRDGAGVRELMRDVRPDIVYHLAALSSVGDSWEEPARTMDENVVTATNVLEAIRLDSPGARCVWVSSCQVYGTPEHVPVAEDARPRPDNPYAVSKTAGELLAAVYVDAYELNLVVARPFNHTGPGQPPFFIVSSIARQAAQGRLDGADPIRIVTGNPDTRRDFTHVRDVVGAYRLLARSGAQGTFNVSSGRSLSAADQVGLLAELLAPLEVEHVVDRARVRAHEVMDLSGDNTLICEATGWQPETSFTDTLRETLEWWEGELAGAGSGASRGVGT